MVCYMKDLPDPIWWTNAYTNLRHAHGTNESKGNEIKDFDSFYIMFFVHWNKQNTGLLGWPLQLLNWRHSKVCLIGSLPLHHNGCIFLAFNNPSQLFLQGDSLVRTLDIQKMVMVSESAVVFQNFLYLFSHLCEICNVYFYAPYSSSSKKTRLCLLSFQKEYIKSWSLHCVLTTCCPLF